MIRDLLTRPRRGSTASAGRSRQVTAAESWPSWVITATFAVAGTVLAAAVLLGGKLAYLLTGRGWPAPGWWTGVLGVFADPGDPTAAWPAVDGHPPAALVWVLTVMLAVAGWGGAAVAAVALLSRRPRSTPGLATDGQEKWLTATGLREQATAMRPQLTARTQPRDLAPEQLGSRLGRSVTTDRPIYRPIETSSITCGLSGASKTMSVVIPTVLDWADRQVVSSTKVDILRHTWQAAADRGGLRTFDPLGLSGGVFPSLRWTPIQGCDDPDLADARTAVLTDRGGGPDPHADFAADGRRVVRALLHAAGLGDCDLRTLLGWVYNPLDKRPEQLIRSRGGHTQFADELAAVRATPDKQREGSYLSVRAAFDGMSTPRMLAVLGHKPSESFDPTHWTLHGRDSLYLLSHHKMLPGTTRVVTLLVSAILDAARLNGSASTGGRLDPPLPIIADEATNTCRLPDWETVLADSRGWGISAHMVVQGRNLLRGAFGRDAGEAIWSAAGMRVLIGGGDGGADSKEVAEAFGDVEVATVSRDAGGAMASVGSRRQPNRTVADIRNIAPGRGIVMASQTPPIEVQLTPWWQRPDAPLIERATRTYDEARRFGIHLAGGQP
jgi:type IV secretion system protein VirD4